MATFQMNETRLYDPKMLEEVTIAGQSILTYLQSNLNLLEREYERVVSEYLISQGKVTVAPKATSELPDHIMKMLRKIHFNATFEPIH